MFRQWITVLLVLLFLIPFIQNLWSDGSQNPPYGIEIYEDRFRNVAAVSEETNDIYFTSFGLKPFRISSNELQPTDAILVRARIQNSILFHWSFNPLVSVIFDNAFQNANHQNLPVTCGLNGYSYIGGNDLQNMTSWFGEEIAEARYYGGSGSWASPVLVQEQDLLIILNKSGVLMCIDANFASNNCVLWSTDLRDVERSTYPHDHFRHEFMATPTVIDNNLYVSGIYNIFKIDLQNINDPAFLQVIDDPDDHLVAPVSFNLDETPNHYLIAASYNGEIRIVDEDLNQINESSLGDNYHITSKPLVDADGQVYIASDNGKIFHFGQETMNTPPLNVMDFTCGDYSFTSTLIADSTNTIFAFTEDNDILKIKETYNFSNYPNSVLSNQWDNDYLFKHLSVNHRVINNHSVLFEKYSFNSSCLLSIYNDGINPFLIDEEYYNNFDPDLYDIIIRLNNTLDENGGTFYETCSQTASFGGIAPYRSSNNNKINSIWLDEQGYAWSWDSFTPTSTVQYSESFNTIPLIPETVNPKFMCTLPNIINNETTDVNFIIHNHNPGDFEAYFLNSYCNPTISDTGIDFTLTFHNMLQHPNYTFALIPITGDPLVFENINISETNNTIEFYDELNVNTSDVTLDDNNILYQNILIYPGYTLEIDGVLINVFENVTLYNEGTLIVHNDGELNILGTLLSTQLYMGNEMPGVITNGNDSDYGFIDINNISVEDLGVLDIEASKAGNFLINYFCIADGGIANFDCTESDTNEPICYISDEFVVNGTFNNYDELGLLPNSSCIICGNSAEFNNFAAVLYMDNSEMTLMDGGKFKLFIQYIYGSELNLCNSSSVTIIGSESGQDAELYLGWGSVITGFTPTIYPPGEGESSIPGDRITAENGGIITTGDDQNPGATITINSSSGDLWDGIYIENPDDEADYWFVNCDISGICNLQATHETREFANIRLVYSSFHDCGQIVMQNGQRLFIEGTAANPCLIENNGVAILSYSSPVFIKHASITGNETGIYLCYPGHEHSEITNSYINNNYGTGLIIRDRIIDDFSYNQINNNTQNGIVTYKGVEFEEFQNNEIMNNGWTEYAGFTDSYLNWPNGDNTIDDAAYSYEFDRYILKALDWRLGDDPIDVTGNSINHSDLSRFYPYYEGHDSFIFDEGMSSPPKEMLASGMDDYRNEDYSSARTTFEQLIIGYPEAIEAATALQYIYFIENYTDCDFASLLNYITSISAPQNSYLEKAKADITTSVYIIQEDYLTAIDRLEEVIADPPTEADEINALMDEGYCYLMLVEEDNRSLPVKCTVKPNNFSEYQDLLRDLEEQLFNYDSYENGEGIISNNIITNNYPNPFNPETTISFELAKASEVELFVYNIKGQKIKTLTNDFLQAGQHSVIWKGRDNNDKSVSSGIYFYKISNGKDTAIRKMLLLK